MEMTERVIHRGDIYYVCKSPTYGSEQQAGRPAVVVSNDICNEKSDVVEVVYLTTRRKPELPTHVEVFCGGRKSTALCEQITSVAIERLSDYKCRATEAEMQLIDRALCVSIGIPECDSWGGNPLDNWCSEDERMLAMVCLKYLQHVIGNGMMPGTICNAVRTKKAEDDNG